MTRSNRSKSRLSKVDPHDSNVLINHELNGNTDVEIVDSALPKKRCAVPSSSSDSNPGDRSPPKKKRLVNELSRSCKKRQHEENTAENDVQKPKKLQKTDGGLRSWTHIINSDLIHPSSNSGDRHSNFVVASYNISSVSKSFYNNCDINGVSNRKDCKMEHDLLMEELNFINADIICLQHVDMKHWKILEVSLKQKDYTGTIIFEDESQLHGVATFHRTSRFSQLSVDSDKLSKLCFQNIRNNNGLDAATMQSIMQYLEEPEVYTITLLKDLCHKRLLIVGNTRLSNNKSEKPDLKCVQAVGLFWQFFKMICQIQNDRDNNNNRECTEECTVSPSWILCGDFNDSIDSPVYQICRDGYPSEVSIHQLQAVKKLVTDKESRSLIDLLWHSFQHPFTDACNSYSKCGDSSEEEDHIWMSRTALEATRVLMPRSVADTVTSCSQAVANSDGADGNKVHNSLACDVAFMTI